MSAKRRDEPPDDGPRVSEQLAEAAAGTPIRPLLEPPDPDEDEHDMEEAIDALAEAKAEDERYQAWEGIGTERMKAIAEAIREVRAVLYPVTPPDSALAVSHDLSPRVQGAMERALVALAKDLVRLSDSTGPRGASS